MLAEGKNGCEIFAYRIAKAVKEQKLEKVCVDLSTRNINFEEKFVNKLVPALRKFGIDVLVSTEDFSDFKRDEEGVRGVYTKSDGNDIWFLPGADLTNPENRKVYDEKTKVFLNKETAALKKIEENTDADIKLSEELLLLSTVKEIFDALGKNKTEGTVTVQWRKNHPLGNDLIAWARTYCSSKAEDGQQLMHRFIKLVPEKEGDEDFFPKTFEEDAMADHSAFGCLCYPGNGTVAFVNYADYLNAKRQAMLEQISKETMDSFVITEHDWEAARFFFSDLIKEKMKPGQACYGFHFTADPNAEILLDEIRKYVTQDIPTAERWYDLKITLSAGNTPECSVKSFLQTHTECRDRISYETTHDGKVIFITLKSRWNELLNKIENSGELVLSHRDIVAGDAYTGGSLVCLLHGLVSRNLKKWIISEEALPVNEEEILLNEAAIGPFLSKNFDKDQIVEVESQNSKIIAKLLEKYGNNGKRARFFIPSEDRSDKHC